MHLRHLPRAALVALLSLPLAACEGSSGGDWTSPVPFDTAQVWVRGDADSVRLLVEVARSEEQRQMGLMARPSLDPGSGMIFVFDEMRPDSAGFWMWRTRMPLDIAFMDESGVIRTIVAMEPCASDQYPYACTIYEPGVPYWSALEVNQGWFAEHGLGVGAQVRVEELAGDGG